MTPEDVAAAFDVPVELITVADQQARRRLQVRRPSLPVPQPVGTPTEAWKAVGCTVTVGGDHLYPWCGHDVVGAILVGTYPVPLQLSPDDRPTANVILACRRHFDALTAAPPEAPCTTSSATPSPPPP